MKVSKIVPYGFCFGVVLAIQKAYEIRKEYPEKKIFLFGQLVHNEDVMKKLKEDGIDVLPTEGKDKLDLIRQFDPANILVFSAHGHPQAYEEEARKRGILFFDTTCPRVKKNEEEIQNALALGKQVIYIGKKNHPEVVAGCSLGNVLLYDIHEKMDYSLVKEGPIFVVNQTTLSLDELRDIYDDIENHFGSVEFINEICDATRVRQTNLKNFNGPVDKALIIGGKNSSNTDKLVQIAKAKFGEKKVFKIANRGDLKKIHFEEDDDVLLASGTSTSRATLEEIEKCLLGGKENVGE